MPLIHEILSVIPPKKTFLERRRRRRLRRRFFLAFAIFWPLSKSLERIKEEKKTFICVHMCVAQSQTFFLRVEHFLSQTISESNISRV